MQYQGCVGGGVFIKGRPLPVVQTPTLSYTIFDRKGNPYVYLQLKNGTLFTYLFMTMHLF